MRAYQLLEFAGPSGLRLASVPAPVAGPEDLLVDVHAVGVNFPDLLMTRGLYQLKPALPVVPGCEIAGVVRSAPSGSGWATGDPVSAFVWQGAFAEQVVVPVQTAAEVPSGMSLTTAAGMIVNYQTVTFALDRRARLQAGEVVLVLGAAGGIGTAAVQVAKGLGAKVIGGVADLAQVEVARSAGADEVVVLESGYSEVVRGLAGRGVDMVVDPLGDWLFDEALRCLEPEGRVVVVGFAAGAIPKVAVNRLLLRNISVIGAAFGAFLDTDPGLVARQARFLADLVDRKIVEPCIDSIFDFEELPSALEALGQGTIRGKAVVRVREKIA